MDNPPTSAFDLPERVRAKSDHALIGADEQHFRAVADCLVATTTDLTERLDAARRAPGGGGTAALERDLQIHRLTARLRTLDRFGLDLCLGHIVPTGSTEPIYIGRLGLLDAAGRRLLVDWRSPSAEPFFGATRATPMGIAVRRRYRWKQGRIRDYWDEVIAPDGLNRALAQDEESALIASLSSSRTDRMRDVLGTIQADQDAVVRAGSYGALVVDGGPGTGKTVVALHRSAYLLYSETRLHRQHSGLLFVGPHRPYLSYVSDVLPGLGEEGARMCTLQDLVAEGSEAVTEPDPAVAREKASARWTEAVEAAVRFYEEPPTTAFTVGTPWADVRITPRDWAQLFETVEPGTAHNEAQEILREELLTLVTERIDAEVPGDQLRRFLLGDRDLHTTVNRAWPLIEAADLVADLWSVPAYLRRCAPWLTPEQARLLRRPAGSTWTRSDLPLLDAARHRLGDPAAARDERQRRATALADGARRAQVVADLRSADDDGESVVTMLRGKDFEVALADEADALNPVTDLLTGTFGHIVVDEAQELTDTEWQMLVRRCPLQSFTIVGDRAQARHGFAESWQTRLQRVGLRTVQVSTLTINYRTPQEVMTVAEPLIREALPDANVPTSIRSNGIPVGRGSTADLEEIVRRWTAENDDGTACVIGDPTFDSTTRVRSLSPELAKGLEFDLVVLVEPDLFGAGIQGAVDRYVAMTRATRQLVVLTTP